MYRTLILLLLLASIVSQHAASAEERSDWARILDKFGAVGTMVVADERDGESVVWIHDPERAQQQFSPASTFKIPHTLFAHGVLEAG